MLAMLEISSAISSWLTNSPGHSRGFPPSPSLHIRWGLELFAFYDPFSLPRPSAALTTGLAYTYSQDNPGRRVSFYIITFNVIWLPWALIGMTLLMAGPFAALVQCTGILAAHAYDFLTRLYPTFGGGRNVIQTPEFVKKWFGSSRSDRPAIVVKGYGTSYMPPKTQPAKGSTTGGSLAFRKSWGQGRRLGGDWGWGCKL